MTLPAGTRLRGYEILGPLGSGGMGEVYRARDLRLGRDVALKTLPAAVADSGERRARFEREARIVAGLNHPNIVTLFSVEDDGRVLFLTMELVDGESLAAVAAAEGPSFARLLEIAIPIAEALVAAHDRGIIHRDLKPGNVMMTRDGRVKVLDFGLAKIADGLERSPGESTLTAESFASMPGRMIGSVPYMAPEQIRGEPVDARCDLFALGVTLYELATGRRPFRGAASVDVISSILRDAPEAVTSLRPDLPPEIDRFLDRCLAKKPAGRFSSALETLGELRRMKQALERGELVAAGSPGWTGAAGRAHRDELSAAAPASRAMASIAVLPFANRSESAGDEYFSDGLADELLSVLARIRGLRVAARTSSFSFKGKDATAGEIGRALNVACLLEGSVRKSGDRVRISVQLVNASDGYHLWAESYDRKLVDIFDVQDDIAQSVVRELRATLLGEPAAAAASTEVAAEVAKATAGRSANPEAYRLYLEGHHFLEQHTASSRARGLTLLEKAVRLDPEFALAWAELGRGHTLQAANDQIANGFEQGRAAVQRALSLEPALAEAHAVLGWIQLIHDWDRDAAEASTRRALELAPGNASVLRRAAVLAWTQDRVEDAIELNRRSTDQDPLDYVPYMNLGLALQAAARLDEAEGAYRKAIELAPGMIGLHAHIAKALADQGRVEEALAEAGSEPNAAERLQAQALAYLAASRAPSDASRAPSDAGRASSVDADLERVLSELTEKHADRMPFEIAEIHALRGDADQAFAWLDRAFEVRTVMVCDVKVSRRLVSLHGDPRWTGVLRRAGVVEGAAGGIRA